MAASTEGHDRQRGRQHDMIHATSLWLPDPGAGVLLRGASGCGKSDLALRLVDAGAKLISDDYTRLGHENGHIVARAPTQLYGLIEIRGLGVVRLDDKQLVASAPVHLLVDLVLPDLRETIDRMPDPVYERIGLQKGDKKILKILLCGFDASATARIRCAAKLALDPGRLIE